MDSLISIWCSHAGEIRKRPSENSPLYSAFLYLGSTPAALSSPVFVFPMSVVSNTGWQSNALETRKFDILKNFSEDNFLSFIVKRSLKGALSRNFRKT